MKTMNQFNKYQYVRDAYNLPFLKEGSIVSMAGKIGLVVDADYHILVRFDNELIVKRCHPTWETIYYDDSGNILADFCEPQGDTQ